LNCAVRADGSAFVWGNEPGDGGAWRGRLAGRGPLVLAATTGLPFAGELL
jgi:hypothetical protein